MQLNNHHRHWLNKRGISDEVLRLFNIETYDHPMIGECIRIPYSDTHSKYRRDPMDDRKPKYLYDSGGKVTLYGGHLSTNGNRVLITEGELDTLVSWSQNIPAVSSTGGAMSFQEDWAAVLGDKDVYLCFDNDDAGAEGMVKVLQYLPQAYVVLIPEFIGVKDISDYVAKGGDLHELLATAKQYPDVTAVEDDRRHRAALMQSVRFHDKYLDKHRQQHERRSNATTTYHGDDKVLRAKSVPMTDLMEFTRRKALCPFHNERTPSFQYYPKTNTAYCFGGCGRAYDSIDVYRLQHNCSFKQAITDLNKMV